MHLIEEASGDTLEMRVAAALDRVVGTYGLAAMWDREPGKIVAARSGAPVLLGIGEGEFFVASDPAAVLDHTRAVVYLEEGDIAVVTPAGYSVIGRDSEIRVRAVKEIEWLPEAMERGDYPHFMLKEIYEQPSTIRTAMQGHIVEGGQARLNGLNLTDEDCRRFKRVVVLACGTSWHAGLFGRQLIEELTGLPVQVEYASEYRYQRQVALEDALVIAISQSGETADTLEAMRAAKANGARVVGLVNVVGSTIAREVAGRPVPACRTGNRCGFDEGVHVPADGAGAAGGAVGPRARAHAPRAKERWTPWWGSPTWWPARSCWTRR